MTIRERVQDWINFRGKFLHPSMEAMCFDLESLLTLLDRSVELMELGECFDCESFTGHPLLKCRIRRFKEQVAEVVGGSE